MIRRTVLLKLSGVALAGAALLAMGGCDSSKSSGGSPNEVSFSILSTENSQNQQELWAPFLADMEKQTGLKIKPFFSSNYTSLIEAMRFNQVQVGWFSNQSGLEASRRAQAEVFARSSDPSGVDGYTSIIIAGAKSPVTLDKILACDKTLSFGIGDTKSTSGTLAPMTYLFAPRGIDPQTCFRVVRSANHQSNLFSVANGVLDVATNNSTALNLARQNTPKVGSAVKVLWESPRLPEDPIMWRKDLDPAVKEKIRSFFLTYGTAPGAEGERQRANLKQLSFGVFKASDNYHLLPVREMEATEMLLQARAEKNAADEAKWKAELAKIQQEKLSHGGSALSLTSAVDIQPQDRIPAPSAAAAPAAPTAPQ
jgi:phosphonate transport system substrate-binding protein